LSLTASRHQAQLRRRKEENEFDIELGIVKLMHLGGFKGAFSKETWTKEMLL